MTSQSKVGSSCDIAMSCKAVSSSDSSTWEKLNRSALSEEFKSNHSLSGAPSRVRSLISSEIFKQVSKKHSRSEERNFSTLLSRKRSPDSLDLYILGWLRFARTISNNEFCTS